MDLAFPARTIPPEAEESPLYRLSRPFARRETSIAINERVKYAARIELNDVIELSRISVAEIFKLLLRPLVIPALALEGAGGCAQN